MNTVSENTARITQLQVDLNEAEQYSGLSNLEILGIEVSLREDLQTIVSDLANKLADSSFQPSDILANQTTRKKNSSSGFG